MPQKGTTQKKSDASSAFKNLISSALMRKIADAITATYPAFDKKTFTSQAQGLAPLELKDRVRFVRDALHQHLPKDYRKALKILLNSLKKSDLNGFDLWPYTEFVQTYGLDHFDESMQALHTLTQVFTAEFAVRPFIAKYPRETFAQLAKWTDAESHHVRRWVSEGTRPRLPWGERLTELIKDPSPALSLLETLKYDPELYVRKSVANHLNDIAKDNPDVVIRVLQKWNKNCPKTHETKIAWITRHSLRTLIKKGHPDALALIGASSDVKVEVKNLTLKKDRLKMGDSLAFEFDLVSRAKNEQKIVIDYIIHHVKANQERAPKVFKLKSLKLKAGEKVHIDRKHHIKPITTRKYYSGAHLIEIQVNGRVLAKAEWHLKA